MDHIQSQPLDLRTNRPSQNNQPPAEVQQLRPSVIVSNPQANAPLQNNLPNQSPIQSQGEASEPSEVLPASPQDLSRNERVFEWEKQGESTRRLRGAWKYVRNVKYLVNHNHRPNSLIGVDRLIAE